MELKAATCPPLVSDCITPEIQWYQTDFTIVIHVQLTDVHNYYLRVENDHLLFSTIKDEERYYLILYFFGSVIAAKTVHKNVGREIKICLTKTLRGFPWLRLTMATEKNPLILHNVNHDVEESWIRSALMTVSAKPNYRKMNINPDVPSSDEDDIDYEEYDFCID